MVQKLIENKGDVLSCSESTMITDFETGETICHDCGIILQENITDERKDNIPFEQNEHMPTTLTMHDMGVVYNYWQM